MRVSSSAKFPPSNNAEVEREMTTTPIMVRNGRVAMAVGATGSPGWRSGAVGKAVGRAGWVAEWGGRVDARP